MSDLREFGKFRLDTQKKLLWFEDESINLPLKSIEILCLLTETNEVVAKEEILNKIWQGAFIEESNLTSHIYRLRKVFAKYGEAEEIIQTVPKRGYRFTGQLNYSSLKPEKASENEIPIQPLEKLPSDFSAKDLSAKTKRIDYRLPVILCFVILIPALGYFFYTFANNKSEAVKTVAVGKFASLLGTEEEEILALGVKEKLLLSLGNIQDLNVQNVNFDEADAEMIRNAEALLLGTVQKVGGQIRVNLRLLRISDKKQLWSASFDESQTSLFKLQDEISRKITDSLSVSLTKSDEERIYKRPTENKEAYENYLQGRYFFNQRGIDYSGSLKKAKPYFERAIEIDPKFAEAYIGLADVVNLQADEKNKLNPNYDIEYQESLRLISKAFELNPNLAEAYAARGWIQLRYEWNFAEAEKNLLKAIELNRSLTNAYIWLSQVYQVQGKTDVAVKNAEKALAIEPTLSRALGNLTSNYIYAQQCEKAINNFNKTVPFYTNLLEKKDQESRVLANCGKCEEAIPILEEVKQKQLGSTVTAYNLGYCYATKKRFDKAYEELKTLEANPNSGHSIFGRILVYSALGEKENAFKVLSEFSKSKDPRILRILFDPRLQDLKNEQKFQQILSDLIIK